jgi:hypothetical protein
MVRSPQDVALESGGSTSICRLVNALKGKPGERKPKLGLRHRIPERFHEDVRKPRPECFSPRLGANLGSGSRFAGTGQQDSNLESPVLETGVRQSSPLWKAESESQVLPGKGKGKEPTARFRVNRGRSGGWISSNRRTPGDTKVGVEGGLDLQTTLGRADPDRVAVRLQRWTTLRTHP